MMSFETQKPKKSLGQNWLTDETILGRIADAAEAGRDDFVLEIGPGLGTLTKVLAERAGKVLAVEFDKELAAKLNKKYKDSPTVKIVNEDFLQFNLSDLPRGYKVVGNIPYYITSKIVQKLLTAENKSSRIVLLVQKEVAERLARTDSVLGVSAQVYAEVELSGVVGREMFTPSPKVDSQVVTLTPLAQTIFGSGVSEKEFFRIVKAGYSERRKKLRSSLAGGLAISKQEAEEKLGRAGIDANLRAQDLSVEDWARLVVTS